ncbi:hypothetical protein Rs2_46098 [Raphanus sativus]|nr:hypothetical protein Rs2_46098 [Raphanus sativus]
MSDCITLSRPMRSIPDGYSLRHADDPLVITVILHQLSSVEMSDEKAEKLVQVTKEALDRAISICGPGVEYKKIGKTIQSYLYRVIMQININMEWLDTGRMVLNQTFTIEPTLTVGSIKPVVWDDDWTVVTEDASLSAVFEHTILITKDGAEILTEC